MAVIQQALLMRSGGVVTPPADGDIVILLSADVEPTGGGGPNWWDGVSGGGAPATSTTPTGVHSRAYNNTGGVTVIIDPLPVSTLTPGAGIRFYVTSNTTAVIFRLASGATNVHLEVGYVAGGNFRVNRGATQLAISTGGHIALNTQYYVTISGVVADSPNGSFTCNLYDDSGTLLESISASGVDTRDGSSSVDKITIGPFVGYWENFWLDLDGEDYGRSRVELTAPNGAGDLTQLATGGSHTSDPNWQQIDEIPVAGAGVDHVISTGANQRDCYTFGNRSVSGTPIASGVTAACLSSAGTVNFNFFVRIGGVNYDHSQTFTMTTTAKMFGAYWRNNPATNAPWTDSGINAAQFGVHIHATNGAVRGLYRATLVQL